MADATGSLADAETRPTLTLFGPLTLHNGQTSLPIGGGRARAVLALLALEHPRPVTTNAIIDAVWGEDPPESARNATQVAVSSLRRLLRPIGSDIARAGDGYVWRPGDIVLDLSRFDQWVAEGRAALRAGELSRGLELLKRSVRCRHGRPLADLDTAFAERARLGIERTHRLARTELAEALIAMGRAAEAVELAGPLHEEAPYDERIVGVLVTAQYALGAVSDAVESWTAFRRGLADELGLDPSPESQALFEQVLNHRLVLPAAPRLPDAEVGLVDAASAAGSQPTEAEPFARIAHPELILGRDELVADVCARLGGGSRLVTLVGLGGIGKTTVARAVAHQAGADGSRVVFGELENVPDVVAAVSRIAHDVGVGMEAEPMAALLSLSAEQCAMLVLDNVEQIEDVGALLDRLVDGNDQLAILVTSRRPTAAMAEVVVTVPPLPVHGTDGWGAAAELFWSRVHQLRPTLDAASQRDDVLAICDLVEGVPLAIQLLAGLSRVLTPRQLLHRIRDHADLMLDTSGGAAISARHRSLRAVLSATVASLPPPAQRLLSTQSAIEGWITLELLETVSGEGDFITGVDALLMAGLVEVDDGGRTRMLVPVREHVRDQWAESSMEPCVSAVEQLLGTAQRALVGPSAQETVTQLDRDADVIVSVLRYVLDRSRSEAGWSDRAARLVASRRPASSWISTSWWSSAQSSPTNNNLTSPLRSTTRSAACRKTRDLMVKCSRQDGGHDIPSAVCLPDHR